MRFFLFTQSGWSVAQRYSLGPDWYGRALAQGRAGTRASTLILTVGFWLVIVEDWEKACLSAELLELYQHEWYYYGTNSVLNE